MPPALGGCCDGQAYRSGLMRYANIRPLRPKKAARLTTMPCSECETAARTKDPSTAPSAPIVYFLDQSADLQGNGMKSHLGRATLRYWIVLSACVFVNSGVIAAASPQPYVIQSATCNGFPRVAVDMVPGYCMGLFTSPCRIAASPRPNPGNSSR
jgi:hypothetical protein